MLTISLLHIIRFNNTESAIFISLIFSLLPEDLQSELIEFFFTVFPEKIRNVSCESSARQRSHMKHKALFFFER